MFPSLPAVDDDAGWLISMHRYYSLPRQAMALEMPKSVALSGAVAQRGTSQCACGCGYVFAAGDLVYEQIRPSTDEASPLLYDHFLPEHWNRPPRFRDPE